jgi:peroxiredoxin Q/BCP
MRRIVFLSVAVVALLALTMSYAAAVEVGDRAPDFELPSTQGGLLKLGSFLGKKNLLIEFYVLEFTPT